MYNIPNKFSVFVTKVKGSSSYLYKVTFECFGYFYYFMKTIRDKTECPLLAWILYINL